MRLIFIGYPPVSGGFLVEKSMNDISTANLVKELETREGVELIIAEPYDNKTITVEGPAVVLVVKD